MNNSKINIHKGVLSIDVINTYHKLDEDVNVKLFKIKFTEYVEYIAVLRSFLTPEENIRADKYYQEKDRNRFIISKVLLKFILAQEAGIPVSEISFEITKHKKPLLKNHPNLHFNLSHAGDYAVIAIANKPVGVDIEHSIKNFDFKAVLAHVFNAQEIDAVLNADDKKDVFYKFWTRKEAVVKATGQGIDDNFPKVPALDGKHILNTSIWNEINNIEVFSFKMDDDYMGTVALTGNIKNNQELHFYPVPIAFDKLKMLRNNNTK